MPTKKPVALGALLSRSTTKLAEFSRRIDEREQLALTLRSAFPKDIEAHLVSAEVKNDRLVLVADNAVWAARMRFYTGDALKVMAAIHSSVLEQVDFRVRPPQNLD